MLVAVVCAACSAENTPERVAQAAASMDSLAFTDPMSPDSLRIRLLDRFQEYSDSLDNMTFEEYLICPEDIADSMDNAEPILHCYRMAFDKVLDGLQHRGIKDGEAAVWLLYNMGIVVKTPSGSFAIDPNHRLSVRLAPYIDFLCITHNHDDHKCIELMEEMKRLGHSDYIIAHNDSMKQWLESRGCRVPVGTLKIFDFLSSRQARPRSTAGSPYTVVYAGALNIRKNRFLYEWGALADNYDISIYGNGFEPEQAKRPEKFRMMGFVPSDKLISTASGDFGLVWDGASTEACTGDWGEYLKINAPHKTSLYLRCLLPVIIWDKAAMAPFVRDNGVGICISSLSQLGEALAAITPEKYARMLDNVRTVSSNLADGYYIRTAVREAADKLNRNL